MARNSYMMPVMIALTLMVMLVGLAARADATGTRPPSVFEIPRIRAQFTQHQIAIQALFKEKKYIEAEQRCKLAIQLVPHHAASYYHLAAAQARQGKIQVALASLANAIELGFNRVDLIYKDDDLIALRKQDQFGKLVLMAARTKPKATPWQYQVEPTYAVEGRVLVSDNNTTWNVKTGAFNSFFDMKPDDDPETSISNESGELGDLLRRWYKAGTAAGNHGDFYDNHDADHSSLDVSHFPQLTRIVFSDAAKKYQFHTGLQTRFLYNGIVIGNSSTAITNTAFWRSQPRLAYTNPRAAAMLYEQYTNNHLYVYPEHRDHDPGHNGDGGYGDVYAANTPYVIISQGSSGSDRVFLEALAATLSSFHPDVKTFLAEHGALMPTVQMIFRTSNLPVKSRQDYFTGTAHPTVFDGKLINPLKMMKLAQAMTLKSVPPVVQLRVVAEEKPVMGRDYFDVRAHERLFDTPAAIARVMRSTQYDWRMIISAEDSHDLHQKPLSWHWVVLRGAADKILLEPLNDAGSVVEITVPYHPRRPIAKGAVMTSNRIDIGVFVDNGTYSSAPGFITWFSLDNEVRTYNDKNQIKTVVYTHPEDGGNYVDPAVATPKSWHDEYHYDAQDRLIGWTRHRGDNTQRFTADGALVTQTDEEGRPLEARTVTYTAQRHAGGIPVLEQRLGDKILRYQYDSPDDQLGRISAGSMMSP